MRYFPTEQSKKSCKKEDEKRARAEHVAKVKEEAHQRALAAQEFIDERQKRLANGEKIY